MNDGGLTERNGIYSMKRTAPMVWDMSNTRRRDASTSLDFEPVAGPRRHRWVKKRVRRIERHKAKREIQRGDA